ncbi:hypothetical protein JOM56_004106 [Amanita muscaria]
MFSFLSRMRLPGFGQDNGDDDDQSGLPLPATHKYQDKPGHRRGDSASSLATLKDGKPLPLNTLTISAPIPRSSPSSITGFDNDNFYPISGGGSSNASVSSGSMVTAYQYHQPTSFSALHQYQQQQQSSGVDHQSSKFYQNPAYSQSVIQLHVPALSRMAHAKGWIPSDEIGVAIGGEGDPEEADMTEFSLADQERMARYAESQFPAVIRLDSGDYSYVHEDSRGREYAADQIGRSASAPPSGVHILQHPTQYQQNPQYAMYGLDSSYAGDPLVNAGGPGFFDLRLNLDANAQFAQSVQSLRLVDHIAAASATDVFAGAYDYPRAKQLSPIAEVDYVSPDSLKKTQSLPFMSNFDLSATAYSRQNTNNTNTTNISPGGASQGSEVTRPSPVYSSPFITRPLNRTVSQTSSRTHVSTTSSVPTRVTTATMKAGDPPPSLPPLDLKPPFPGPHPSHSGTLRPPKPQRTFGGLSTIVGSDEGGGEGSKYTSDDVASLHADSFVTASTRSYDNEGGAPPSIPGDEDYGDDEGEYEKDEKVAPSIHRRQLSASGETLSDLTSVHSGRSRVRTGSESFIARRWESDAGYGSGGRVAVLRTKKKAWLDATPAFWAFWLGFVCPFLWLIGGWHFTSFGEQPPKLSFWEFYFNTGYWTFKLKPCYGRRKEGSTEPDERQEKRARIASKKGKDKQQDPPPVTRWVAEKQSSDQRRERLYDPKRSMRGILFGYPFIARPMRHERKSDWAARALGRLIKVIAVPNRLFDHLYGVKLTEVRGRPETSRRMFDPWIQRSRYAFCYALIVLSIGLCITSTYLIIYNTRQLRA